MNLNSMLPGALGCLVFAAASLASAVAAAPGAAGIDRAPSVPPGRKVIVITGSTDGLGREVARRLAETGAHIVVHGRNRERGAEVVKKIEQAGKGSARFYAADLASLAQVRDFGNTLLRDYERIDVLINNAGIWLNGGNKRQLSADGHEMHFAVNYLSGFLLTRMLLPRLIASAPSRIINVASGAQSELDFDNLMLAQGYSDGRGYSNSKLAQVMFTFDLARALAGTGVSVNTLHPATLMNTTMVKEHDIAPRSTVAEGAAAVVNLVTTPTPGNGQYFNGLIPARANAQAYREPARVRLRQISEKLTQAPPVRARN